MALGERLSNLGTTPFVGRRRELAELVRQFDDAERGRSSIVLLAGEPGIGKTRLAEELCAVAEARGAVIYWGECFEGEGPTAFWPWVQILRTWIRAQRPEALRSSVGDEAVEIAQILPELRARIADLPEPSPLAPSQARFRLFDSIVTVLRKIATRPLVLVLDDLHWSDEPSLLLLEFLAAQLADAPILVLGIYRDVEVAPGHALSSTLGGLLRRPRILRILLGRLSPGEVAELVDLTTGTPSGARVARGVLDRAEGNPLFVGEMLRLLDAERVDPTLYSDADRVVPPTIQDVIGRRLSKLSASCRDVLTLAAVIGREFDLMTLRAATGGDDRTIDALAEAEEVRIVGPAVASGPAVHFRFTHAMVRDALYAAVPASRRARLHLLVGTTLEQMAEPTSEARLSELAHHFVQAASISPPERVVGHVERAAEQALRVLAYEDAARLYALALRLLESSPNHDPEARCTLLVRLGSAQSSMTDDAASRESFIAAAALARQVGPRVGASCAAHLLAQAALGYAGMARLEHRELDERGMGLLQEALEAVGDPDTPIRAQLLSRLRTATSWQQTSETNRPASREAVALARRVGDPQALAEALLYQYHSLTVSESLDEVLDLYEEMQVLGKRLGDPVMQMNSKRWHVKYLLEVGDLAAADVALAEYERMMSDLRYPLTDWRSAVARMSRALLVGDFLSAEQAADEAAQVGPRQPRQGAPWFVAGELHLLRAEQGRLDEAEQVLDELRRDYPNAHGVRSARAWILHQRGAVDEARRELDLLAANDFADLRHGGAWNYSITFLAQLCADLDDRTRAAHLYEILLPQAPYNVVSGITFTSYGAAAHYLGRLAATLDRADVATSHFDEALRLHERLQARPMLAHTCYRYAAALLDLKADGTPEQARHLAQRASDEAKTLGMSILHARAAALLTRAASAKQSAAPSVKAVHPDGLTGREVEVLALLAAGASNAEIARALVLSPGTIHTHTVRIYQKIGVRGRAEASAYAERHGLTFRNR